MIFKDYYKILGVSQLSDEIEIKCAYRQQSKVWHPDKNPGKDVNEIMLDINEAYAILKDPAKRSRYDQEYERFFGTPAYSDVHQEEEDVNTEPAWTYDYEVQDEGLKEDIKNAREYAKELVDEFMQELKASGKAAVKGAASNAFKYAVGWIAAGIVLTILGGLIRSCN